MSLLLLFAALMSAGSLDSLDACLQEMQQEIRDLEEEEAAISTILDAMHQHLATSRKYYNELALEEAEILRQLNRVSGVFTREDSLREALVESLSSYMIYLYSHRNLGGIGSFFAQGGYSRMLHRQAYVDYLATRAANEVFMLSLSRDSLVDYRDSLEVLLVNVQHLRRQMVEIQENIYREEQRQAELQERIMGRIAAAQESLEVIEERRISRAEFVTRLSTESSGQTFDTPLPQPSADSYFERERGSLAWPAQGRVVRNFGRQVHEEYGTETTSDGIIVVTPPAQNVCAVEGGLVLFASEYLGGKMVVVDHQDGYYTIYRYLGQLLVSTDEAIEQGTQLARVGPVPDGQPGYYFEIRKGGEPVDPIEYLR